MTITEAELKAALTYDPETGLFRWRKSRFKRWVGSVAGYRKSNGYWAINIRDKLLLAHRLAWLYQHGAFPVGDLDHKNGDKTDNRIANLRVVNDSLNQMNSLPRADNKSGVRGVHWDQRKQKWVAKIGFAGKIRSLGEFKNKTDAVSARLTAEQIHHGEYSYRARAAQNDPPPDAVG